MVRLNVQGRYYLGRVPDIQWREEMRKTDYGEEMMPIMYNMTNGKKTNVRLELVYMKDLSVSKGFKVRIKLNQLSNQKFSDSEYHLYSKIAFDDNHAELIERKTRQIQNARNYKYKPG